MSESLIIYILLFLLAILAVVVVVMVTQGRTAARATLDLQQSLEDKHRAMLGDLHDGLTKQGDRLGVQVADSSERQRTSTAEELKQTRDVLHALRLTLTQEMGTQREAMLERLTATTESLNAKIDARLGEIAGKVNERLDEGFKKTNETFVSVMTRLATIDEAQKKIESLTGSVVSLQELLGDKRARGAFGEVQLEGLVRNVLPPNAYEMQATLSNGTRADCVLRLPAPTGMVAVDSKFPLENYHRMFEPGVNDVDRALAQKQFRNDIKKHVDDISRKYIIPGETSDGAVMFVPAEAVFAEIHAHHAETVEYASAKRVWIVSPTTLMAVLNTARAVLKDVETRKQIHVIKDELAKLGLDFSRFEERMRKLADHVRQAHEDAQQVQISSKKISQRFRQIEGVELDGELEEAEVLKLRDGYLIPAMGWFARWRRGRAAQRSPVSAAEWSAVIQRFSFLRALNADEQARLRDLVAAFLTEKSLQGAGGLTITRDIGLVIAAQACLLVLNLDLDYYDDWVEIIVYPEEFIVDHEYTDEDGVVHHVRAPLSGEAWEQGPVVLSWQDAEAADGGDGYNVVMHEFAHKIDMLNGAADGFPPLHVGMDREAWTRIFTEAFADFERRLDAREDTLIDEYAAEDPAEFFAVLSELFFERPDALQADYPAVYEQLSQFYRQNPLARLHAAA